MRDDDLGDLDKPVELLPVEGIDYAYTDETNELHAWDPIRILRGPYAGIVFQIRNVKLEALAKGVLQYDCRILRQSDKRVNITDKNDFRATVGDIVSAVILDWCELYEAQKGMNDDQQDDSQVVDLR